MMLLNGAKNYVMELLRDKVRVEEEVGGENA